MANHDQLLSLPFETAPEVSFKIVGNERTGTLKFPVYNDLTITESAWMSANGAKDTAFKYTSRLALKISRDTNAKPIDTHAFVSKVMVSAMGGSIEYTPQELDWQVRYIKELEEVAFKVLEVAVINQQQLVTCLIRHRLPKMENWTGADTANLPTELCEEIYAFAQQEQSRGKEVSPDEARQDLEELLGKPRTEATNPPSPSTGESASTSSETSTPPAKSSRRKRSASSKAATSSSASTKAPDSDESTSTPSSSQ